MRVLTHCDGNENPYVFTWSDDVPNSTWATGSGCSTFYNTADEAESNTHMCVCIMPASPAALLACLMCATRAARERDFANNSFVITATKDIAEGEELLHVYKSKAWRKCFQEL